MTAVTISVASWDEVKESALAAFSGEYQGHFISFETPEQLWRTLTPKRWELIKLLTGAEPMSIREAARRAGRDVKGVHSDITALLHAGVVDRTEGGLIHFPYDVVHVDFTLTKAA